MIRIITAIAAAIAVICCPNGRPPPCSALLPPTCGCRHHSAVFVTNPLALYPHHPLRRPCRRCRGHADGPQELHKPVHTKQVGGRQGRQGKGSGKAKFSNLTIRLILRGLGFMVHAEAV